MIRILVVADIRLYRDGLVEILSRKQELLVVGTAENAAGALAQAAALSPDVILVDQAMPESVSTIRALLALRPSVKIISLAVRENEREVIACAEAGVSGYVPREASLDDLLAVVDSVGRGELLCSPQVAASLLRRVAWRATSGAEVEPATPLTVRELEIVRLIEQGLSNKEIAVRLGIEVATVKNHVHNLLEKLRVHRRGEAAAFVRGREPLQI